MTWIRTIDESEATGIVKDEVELEDFIEGNYRNESK